MWINNFSFFISESVRQKGAKLECGQVNMERCLTGFKMALNGRFKAFFDVKKLYTLITIK